MPRGQPHELMQGFLPSQDTIVGRAQVIAAMAFERASATDVDGGFPTQDIQDLRERGLLLAPFPADLGGEGLGEGRVGASNLFEVLRALGRGNLALGRLYEGHVNAALLLCRYGSPQQIRRLALDVRRGALLGVWNAENP